jgi:hypothetical protein
MDRLLTMQIFVQLIDSGSFAAAAWFRMGIVVNPGLSVGL